MELLQSLPEMKSYLEIDSSDTTYDNFLLDQGEVISSAIETYCKRNFKKKTYTQEFYKDELFDSRGGRIGEVLLYHYPVINVNSVLEGTEAVSDYRVVKSSGVLRKKEGLFLNNDVLTVEYIAGYTRLPALVREVFYSLLSERYNKKVAGVDLNFGKNVQRVSIPGTISIDYDYTLDTNNRNTPLGIIVGDTANVLDQFVSERAVMGSLREGYVYS
jgi:hypothetical protein